MNKFLLMLAPVIMSGYIFAAASSSDEGVVEASPGVDIVGNADCPLAKLIRVFTSKSYPHISMKCTARSRPARWLSPKDDELKCYLVGHADQTVRHRLLEQAIDDPEAMARFYLRLCNDAELVERDKLFFAIINIWTIDNEFQSIGYDAYDLSGDERIAGAPVKAGMQPWFGVFKARPAPRRTDLINPPYETWNQKFEFHPNTAELRRRCALAALDRRFERFLERHDAVGFRVVPSEVLAHFSRPIEDRDRANL